jgi:hypothetical protein
VKVKFTVYIEGSGPNVVKAYQDMRRKLLPLRGWADSDEATVVDEANVHTYLPEEDVQVARTAFKHSKDGLRLCNGGDACIHDVVVYGIPACMMSAKEVKKMVKRGHRLVKNQDKSS